MVTGRDVRNARPGRDEFGKWETEFTLSQDAAERFGRFTEANIGNRLAIVLDGQVRSAPTIQCRIEDSGRITGAANEQEASDLAMVLKAGSLPAGIVYLEERTVGPSLGADSIREGFIAGLSGIGAVVLLMLLYYRKAGVNATLALILNAMILLAVLSYFDAVLTLPGIAGVILTIGMAVDSNVLIFERIRKSCGRQGDPGGHGHRVRKGVSHHHRHPCHDDRLLRISLHLRHRSGEGFAVTLTIGLAANCVHRGLRVEEPVRLGSDRNPRMTRIEYLSRV